MSKDLIQRCMRVYCTPSAKRQTRKRGGSMRQTLANCKLTSCNPTCKNTSFGPELKLSKKLRSTKRYRVGEKWRRKFEKTRRRLFGTQKNILDNGFYKKMPKAMKDNLRAQGAISGCH